MCLTAICERIGAHWYVDYDNDLHAVHERVARREQHHRRDAARRGRSHADRGSLASRDEGDRARRRRARGVDTPLGATELPVDEGVEQSWYSPTGGIVETGHAGARVCGMRGRGGAARSSAAAMPRRRRRARHRRAAVRTPSARRISTARRSRRRAARRSPGLSDRSRFKRCRCPRRSHRRPHARRGHVSAGHDHARRDDDAVHACKLGYVGGAIGPTGAIAVRYTWDGNDWEIYLGPPSSVGGGVWYPALEPSGFVAPVNLVQVYRSDNGGAWYPCNSLPSIYSGSAAYWWGGNAQSYGSGSVVASTRLRLGARAGRFRRARRQGSPGGSCIARWRMAPRSNC